MSRPELWYRLTMALQDAGDALALEAATCKGSGAGKRPLSRRGNSWWLGAAPTASLSLLACVLEDVERRISLRTPAVGKGRATVDTIIAPKAAGSRARKRSDFSVQPPRWYESGATSDAERARTNQVVQQCLGTLRQLDHLSALSHAILAAQC